MQVRCRAEVGNSENLLVVSSCAGETDVEMLRVWNSRLSRA